MAFNNSSKIDYLQAFTIANGESESNVLDLQGDSITALITPAFDGTNVAVQASTTIDGTFMPVYDSDGVAVEIPITGPGYNLADPLSTMQLRFVKLVSDATQTADRTLTVAAQPI